MVAPIRFLSGRQQQQKIGVPDSTEDLKVLEVVGRAGIGTTIFEPDHELDIRGTTKSTTYLGEGGALTLGSSSDGRGKTLFLIVPIDSFIHSRLCSIESAL